MKITELRIGNLVQGHKDRIRKITRNSFCPSGSGNEIYVQPIPLTEEWLINLGFKEENCAWFKSSWNREQEVEGIDYIIDFDGDIPVFYQCHSGESKNPRNWEILTYIRFVHQLQNLYFALTGEELNIE